MCEVWSCGGGTFVKLMFWKTHWDFKKKGNNVKFIGNNCRFSRVSGVSRVWEKKLGKVLRGNRVGSSRKLVVSSSYLNTKFQNYSWPAGKVPAFYDTGRKFFFIFFYFPPTNNQIFLVFKKNLFINTETLEKFNINLQRNSVLTFKNLPEGNFHI